MDINDILAEIINDIADGKELDLTYYCSKYPDYKAIIKEKLHIASFIKKGLAPEDLSGKALGEYYLMREIGRGGMGIVYLAIHSRLSRLTAIKVLPSHFLTDKQALKNFQEEAKIIAKFNHPNIVPIYSIDEDIGIHYISMGYVHGITLKVLIERLRELKADNPIKVSQIKEILAQACDQDQTSGNSITLKRDEKFWTQSYANFVATLGKEISSALSYAHENGICHGDIKPSNILLSRDAIPMIVDFGLSRSFKGMPQLKSDEFAGTLAYAAPEQIKSGVINQKTDIWSVGATLYELLTLKNPFVSNTTKKTVENVSNGNPPLLRTINKKIPIELEAITLKCLEKNPGSRYASTEDLAIDLQSYLDVKPIKARPISPLGRFQKVLRRHPAFASILIILLGIGIGFSAIFYKAGIYKNIDKSAYLSLNKMLQEASSLRLNSNFKESKAMYQNVLDKAIDLAPSSDEAYRNRGHTYFFKGELDKALEDYDKSLKLNANSPDVYLGRGNVFIQKGLYDKAIKDFTKSIELKQSNPLSYSGRAQAYYYNKDFDKAWADVHEAEQLGYKMPEQAIQALTEASKSQTNKPSNFFTQWRPDESTSPATDNYFGPGVLETQRSTDSYVKSAKTSEQEWVVTEASEWDTPGVVHKRGSGER